MKRCIILIVGILTFFGIAQSASSATVDDGVRARDCHRQLWSLGN